MILKKPCCILKSSQSFQNGLYLHNCLGFIRLGDWFSLVLMIGSKRLQRKKIKPKNSTFTRSYVLDIVLASDSDLLESCQRCEVARQPAKNSERYCPRPRNNQSSCYPHKTTMSHFHTLFIV